MHVADPQHVVIIFMHVADSHYPIPRWCHQGHFQQLQHHLSTSPSCVRSSPDWPLHWLVACHMSSPQCSFGLFAYACLNCLHSHCAATNGLDRSQTGYGAWISPFVPWWVWKQGSAWALLRLPCFGCKQLCCDHRVWCWGAMLRERVRERDCWAMSCFLTLCHGMCRRGRGRAPFRTHKQPYCPQCHWNRGGTWVSGLKSQILRPSFSYVFRSLRACFSFHFILFGYFKLILFGFQAWSFERLKCACSILPSTRRAQE